MNCHECQTLLADRAAAGPEAAAHLAGCAACRQFHAQWDELEPRLLAHAGTAALPADFAAQLQARLSAPARRLSPAEAARRRHECELEYERLRRRRGWRPALPSVRLVIPWRKLRLAAGCIGAGALLAITAPHLPRLFERLPGAFTTGPGPMLLGAALAVAVTGLALGRARPRWFAVFGG